MTKWMYLGITLALAGAAGLVSWSWAPAAGVMAIVTGLRFANDRRRDREASRDRH